MIECVRRMAGMWFRNRKWCIEQDAKFPKQWSDDALKSFLSFKNRTLRYWVPEANLAKMSQKAKNRKFKSLYPGRAIWHYNHYIKGGTVYKEEVKYYLPRFPRNKIKQKQYWFLRGKVQENIRKILVIKPSKTCRFRRVVPFKVGFQPQKYINYDKRFYEWVAQNKVEGYDPLIHDRITVTGSWPSQWQTLQTLCDPVEAEATFEDYIKGIECRGDKLFLPSLPAPTLESIDLVKTKPRSFTGCVSSKLFGQTHREADRYLKPLAKMLFKISGSRMCCDNSVWQIGGRSREQKLWVDKPTRSRCLLMPEGAPKIFGLSYAQGIYDALGQINWLIDSNEIKLGMPEFHGRYYDFQDQYNSVDPILEADISSHDATCNELSMVVAFGMVRSMFPDSIQIDQHFYYFMSGFIFKNIVTPGRFLYRVLKGIPTGSPFTSIIVSLVNWLNWSSLFTRENPIFALNSLLHIYGDDTLAQLNKMYMDEEHNDPDWWSKRFHKWCGHKTDPCIIRTNTGKEKELDRATFLKYYTNHGLPARHPNDVLLSAAACGSPKLSSYELSKRISGISFTSAFDFRSQRYISSYREWLMRDYYYKNSFGLKPLEIERMIEQSLKVSERTKFLVYLQPIIPPYEAKTGFEIYKLPNEISPTGIYNKQWVREIARSNYFIIKCPQNGGRSPPEILNFWRELSTS